jgi:hypothetical protein
LWARARIISTSQKSLGIGQFWNCESEIPRILFHNSDKLFWIPEASDDAQEPKLSAN